VIDEVADIGAAEVHPNSDARIRADAGPVRYLDHVQVLSLVRRHGHTVYGQQQEVDLVHVQLVVFERSVLDRPVFGRPLVGNDRRSAVRVEQCRCGAVDGDEEVGRAIRIGGISEKYSSRLAVGVQVPRPENR